MWCLPSEFSAITDPLNNTTQFTYDLGDLSSSTDPLGNVTDRFTDAASRVLVSECRFEIRGEAATSPVVLGEDHDGALLGAVTLETLGFMLNPLTREILPMRMALS